METTNSGIKSKMAMGLKTSEKSLEMQITTNGDLTDFETQTEDGELSITLPIIMASE
jgi:hypothetical protein